MNTVPLVSGTNLDAIFAWHNDGAISVRVFLADVYELAKKLPSGTYILNVCQDNYNFAVGFAAGLITRKVSLQPSSHSPETLRRLQSNYSEVFCLCDGEFNSIDIPRFNFPKFNNTYPEKVISVPQVNSDQCAAILFTSGSTGTPQPHKKTWGKLAQNGRAEADSLGLVGHAYSIVSTVPIQHSYGFESSFLLTLHGGCSFWSGKPFYPHDVFTALKKMPHPRLLVTSPFHLSTLVAANIEPPKIEMLLSATAPLATSLAIEAENRFSAPLFEIYGSTESGQTAYRRTTETQHWTLLSKIKFAYENSDICVAFGGHVEGRVPLSDVIEILSEHQFILHDRHADLINIAGKRTSLAYLNLQICSIPGVVEAAFFLPENESMTGVTRLCVAVVAPGLDRRKLLTLLRDRVDAVFLPRPVIFLDALPRNSTGKVTQIELQTLYVQEMTEKTLGKA